MINGLPSKIEQGADGLYYVVVGGERYAPGKFSWKGAFKSQVTMERASAPKGTGWRRFDVRIGNTIIQRVDYQDNVLAKNVRHALIAEGASEDISVYRNNAANTAYDDVARVTHPEEL